MNPSMLFRYSDNRLDVATADGDKKVDINFWTTNGKTAGIVRLDEGELRKLIAHLNEQLDKISSKPQVQVLKPKNKH